MNEEALVTKTLVNRLHGCHPDVDVKELLFDAGPSVGIRTTVNMLVRSAYSRSFSTANEDHTALASIESIAETCIQMTERRQGAIDSTKAAIAAHELSGAMRAIAFSLFNVREHHQYRGSGFLKWEDYCIQGLGCHHRMVNAWIKAIMQNDVCTEDMFKVLPGEEGMGGNHE